MAKPVSNAVSELYPQCVSLRKELDAALLALSSSNAVNSASTGSTSSQLSVAKNGQGDTGSSVAKLQRFAALTRQFCMLVIRLQEAFRNEKGTSLPRNMHSLWERRVPGLVADAESFRREAEGRMNFEEQRVADAMRERRALLGESRSSGLDDMRNAELMYARERDRLKESNSMLDSVIAQGWGIVGNLVAQNASLKSAHRKVLDMASTAGVASTLLGAVGRRQQGDKWLVYGGMVLTLVFFFVVYRLFHYGNLFGFFGQGGAPEDPQIDSEGALS